MKTQTRKQPTQQHITTAQNDEFAEWCAPVTLDPIACYSLEIKSSRQVARGGVWWEAWLYKNDEPILWVENEGEGGCNTYHPIPGFYDGTAKWRNDHTDFRNAAKSVYPTIQHEHDDILCSFLDLIANDLI